MDNNQAITPQPVNTVVSPPTAPPVPIVPQKSNKKVIVVIAIILIILIITGVAGFFYINNNSSSSTIIPTPTSVVVPTDATPSSPSPVEQTAIEIVLEKGRKVTIPNSDVEVLYVGADIPNPNCIDCSTTTDITLEQKGNEKKLQYLCGGIAGTCTDKLNGFNFQIELVNASETTATVKVLKQ